MPTEMRLFDVHSAADTYRLIQGLAFTCSTPMLSGRTSSSCPIPSIRALSSYPRVVASFCACSPRPASVQTSQTAASSVLPTSPIRNCPMFTVRNPTLLPSKLPTYPLTAVPNRSISLPGIRSHASSVSRCRMSMLIAEPVMPRYWVRAKVRVVRHVRMSGGQEGD